MAELRIGAIFPRSIRRDIVLLICIKAAALLLIYCAFIAPTTSPEPDGRAVAAHLVHDGGN